MWHPDEAATALSHMPRSYDGAFSALALSPVANRRPAARVVRTTIAETILHELVLMVFLRIVVMRVGVGRSTGAGQRTL